MPSACIRLNIYMHGMCVYTSMCGPLCVSACICACVRVNQCAFFCVDACSCAVVMRGNVWVGHEQDVSSYGGARPHLLYIRMSGVQMNFAGRRMLSTPPYSEEFQPRL